MTKKARGMSAAVDLAFLIRMPSPAFSSHGNSQVFTLFLGTSHETLEYDRCSCGFASKNRIHVHLIWYGQTRRGAVMFSKVVTRTK